MSIRSGDSVGIPEIGGESIQLFWTSAFPKPNRQDFSASTVYTGYVATFRSSDPGPQTGLAPEQEFPDCQATRKIIQRYCFGKVRFYQARVVATPTTLIINLTHPT